MSNHPGPFFFAWADASDTTFGHAHIRLDEQVLSAGITHDEGDFPSLEITIINPRVGLLAPSRKVWAWFSVNMDWMPKPAVQSDSESESEVAHTSESASESEHASVIPLFFGRLVGLPQDLDEETVRLTFVAKPDDYQAQKVTVANAKKVRPYWDPIWFNPLTVDNPDNVLESRPELWHIDRTTLQVTTSNIINGEDGTITLGEADVFYDSVHVTYGQAPVRKVQMNAAVSWDQNAAGTVDLAGSLLGRDFTIFTYTGKGLVDSWPKPGASFGGGWSVVGGGAVRVDGNESPEYGFRGEGVVLTDYQTFTRGSPLGDSPDSHDVRVPEWAKAHQVKFGAFATFNIPAHYLRVYRWQIIPTILAGYSASRKKSESLSFALEADVQAIFSEAGADEVLLLTMSSSELTSPVDPAGAMPLGDPGASVYFSSARGTQSIEYLLALARSQLLSRSRAVFVDFEFPLSMALPLELSCRKNMVLVDERLPGGIAAGKIKHYTFSIDGDSGAMKCGVTIGCTVGKGNTVTPVDGTPTYASLGYMNPGYQFYSGAFLMPIAGEVLYETIEGLPANDDGIDFSRMTPDRVLKSITITGDAHTQELAMGTTADDTGTVFDRLKAVPTTIRIELNPVTGGPFVTDWTLNVSQLMVPKTIDLEAESSS